jgi:hypothetical protein
MRQHAGVTNRGSSLVTARDGHVRCDRRIRFILRRPSRIRRAGTGWPEEMNPGRGSRVGAWTRRLVLRWRPVRTWPITDDLNCCTSRFALVTPGLVLRFGYLVHMLHLFNLHSNIFENVHIFFLQNVACRYQYPVCLQSWFKKNRLFFLCPLQNDKIRA